MGELESKLTEAEALVTTWDKNKHGIIGVDNSRRLQDLLSHLFTLNPSQYPTEPLSRVEKLASRIGEKDKSFYLALTYYQLLGDSQFLFAEEVLKDAFRREESYNTNDRALVACIKVGLRKSNIPEEVYSPLLLILPSGHLFNYHDEFDKVIASRPKRAIKIPDSLKETLLYGASLKSNFEQTRAKALLAIVYFRVREAIPELEARMQEYAKIEDNKQLHGCLKQIITISQALVGLTSKDNQDKYLQVAEGIYFDFCTRFYVDKLTDDDISKLNLVRQELQKAVSAEKQN